MPTPPYANDDEKLHSCKVFDDWPDHARHTLSFVSIDGLYCEFGVYRAGTLNHFLKMCDAHFHAFDSFRGLPEKWLDFEQNHLDLGGEPPQLNLPSGRVTLHIGYFHETVPHFVRECLMPIAFLHIDCDLYSSTKTVFHHLLPRIMKDTIIMFDEYETGIDDERQAFLETGLSFEYISRHINGGSVSVRIT